MRRWRIPVCCPSKQLHGQVEPAVFQSLQQLVEHVRPSAGGAPRPLTRDRGRGIRHYFWAEDNRSLLFLQDKDGDENWRLHAADLETGATRDLTPLSGVQAQIVATDPEFPHEILVALNDRDARAHDVYRLDLRTGERRLQRSDPDPTYWAVRGALREFLVEHREEAAGAVETRPASDDRRR